MLMPMAEQQCLLPTHANQGAKHPTLAQLFRHKKSHESPPPPVLDIKRETNTKALFRRYLIQCHERHLLHHDFLCMSSRNLNFYNSPLVV